VLRSGYWGKKEYGACSGLTRQPITSPWKENLKDLSTGGYISARAMWNCC